MLNTSVLTWCTYVSVWNGPSVFPVSLTHIIRATNEKKKEKKRAERTGLEKTKIRAAVGNLNSRERGVNMR